MSGEKRTYVSIEDRELRRLREQESRLRSLSRDLPERLDAIRRGAEQEIQSRLAPIEARLRDQKKAAKGMKSQIDSLVAEAKRKQSTAGAFFNELAKIVGETGKLPHHRFVPGKLDSLRRHVEDARRNMKDGMPEAALSTGQRAYWDIADLRVLVMQKEKEFMILHQTALKEARSLLEEARANRKYQLELGDGEEKDELELEVDYWSRGELSDYEEEIEALKKELINGENTLTIEEVKDILAKIEPLKPRIVEIVEHARQNILASQLRSNVAELAVEALRGQGFEVEDATYEGDDMRNSYIAKVKNIAGSEVVTVISPVEGEFGKNSVSIHSYDETFVDETTLQQRSGEIVGALNEAGLQAEAPECMGDAKPEYRDIAAVRQRKPSEIQAKRREAE